MQPRSVAEFELRGSGPLEGFALGTFSDWTIGWSVSQFSSRGHREERKGKEGNTTRNTSVKETLKH